MGEFLLRRPYPEISPAYQCLPQVRPQCPTHSEDDEVKAAWRWSEEQRLLLESGTFLLAAQRR